MNFNQLGLSDEVLKVLKEIGFEKPSDIQEQSIPILLKDFRDFIGLAQTGTGKTAAFGLPLLERIDPYNQTTQGLILAPTRELGQQIAEQLQVFSKYMEDVNVLAVYGGAPIDRQLKALRKTQHIIIATPGRLIDLIKRKAVNLKELQFLVLDEADEMLNMGFKDELDKILSYTPADKLTWLFSATMPPEIQRIIETYMDDPVEVRVSLPNEVNANIKHRYIVVKRADKTEALTRFLDGDPNMRGLVFCRTRRETRELAEELSKRNYRADALHGELSQKQRDSVMRRFKSYSLQVLIATDVAARGIDVNDITHVFHFTLPDEDVFYTHRSGRTARAGKKGISIAFINGRESNKIARLEDKLDIKFKKTDIPTSDGIAFTKIQRWAKDLRETKAKGKIDQDILDKVNTYFGDLSKEDLIKKLVALELQKIQRTDSKDLNAKIDTSSRGKSSGKSGGKSGGKFGRKKFGNKKFSDKKAKHRKGRRPKKKGRR